MSHRTLSRVLAGVGALALVVCLAPAAGAAKVKSTSCDDVDPRYCLLPWPNNHFTAYNIDTETRRQVRLPAEVPINVAGKRIARFPYRLSDGFSSGGPFLTYVPGVDLKRTGAAPITDLRSATDRGEPVVVIDAATLRRQPIWAELDAGAPTASERLLMIHPAKNLVEGRRYIVALRKMRNSKGQLLKPSREFAALRSGRKHTERYDKMFKTLRRAGIDRSSLYLAWDFSTASQRNIYERLTSIRDNAFGELGDSNLIDHKIKGRPPAFKIDSVQDFAPCGDDGCGATENDLLLRKVSGTLTTSCWLDKPGCPAGSTFRFRKRVGRFGFAFYPVRRKRNTMSVPFVCTIPRAALAKRARASLYGHELFASPEEVMSQSMQLMSAESDIVYCAPRETGMSDVDRPYFESVMRNVSRFPAYTDRLQQGVLNMLLMGRAMAHPQGFASNSAFKGPDGSPLFETPTLFFDSSGMGGNLGTVATALAPDWERAVLGTAGMRYSLIMNRSTAFDHFNDLLLQSYRGRIQRMVVLGLVQTLWDRAEANGWGARVTGDPPTPSPVHEVLIQSALGDHQTPQISAEILARTAETSARQPVFDQGRSADKIPFYGFNPAPRLELESSLTMWDSGPIRAGGLGTDLPPVADIPPRSGADPHGLVAATKAARTQRSAFMQPMGRLLEVCPTDRACRTDTFPY